MQTSSWKFRAWTLLLGVYLGVRFLCTRWLDDLNPYASYLFEFLLVGTALILDRENLSRKFRLPRASLALAAAFLPAGFLVFHAAGWLHIPVPFDLRGGETLFFLLLVAPVLEELIFRFFAWEPLAAVNGLAAFAGTILLFSYAHLHSIWFVPAEVRSFVIYQAVYTLVLAAGCGICVRRYGSLSGAMAVHFAFNLGFYLGSLI
jgi:membrane protease YdiL (CAAX protease family)